MFPVFPKVSCASKCGEFFFFSRIADLHWSASCFDTSPQFSLISSEIVSIVCLDEPQNSPNSQIVEIMPMHNFIGKIENHLMESC